MPICRQANEISMALQPFLMRHIEIESLHEMQLQIFQAKSVYIKAERNVKGEVAMLLVVYRRTLTNIWFEDSVGNLGSLTKMLPLHSYSLSFYGTGIH